MFRASSRFSWMGARIPRIWTRVGWGIRSAAGKATRWFRIRSGFNDRSWLRVFPHTEMLHVVQRYRRPDLGHLEKELTIEDPGAFRKPWKIRDIWDLAPGEEIAEYICNENEKDVPHLK